MRVQPWSLTPTLPQPAPDVTGSSVTTKMLMIKSIDPHARLELSEYTGEWYVASHIWICDGVIESGITEHRPTPESAILRPRRQPRSGS